MAFQAKVKVDLNFPIIKLQKELVKVAQKVIIPDIEGRMNSSIDISGNSYQALSKKTISSKQKKGLRTETLMATGQLRSSFKFKPVGKDAVRITPSGTRKSHNGERIITNKELSDILQNKGVRTKFGKRFFEFFGISDKAEAKSVKLLDLAIRKAVRVGGRRIIR